MKKLFLYLSFLCLIVTNGYAELAETYDADAPGWASNLTLGDPLDNGTTARVYDSAIDSQGVVYTVYTTDTGGGDELLYINRLKNNLVETWDEDNFEWTTDFALGDPIDAGNGGDVISASLAIDSTNRVYIVYIQSDGLVNDLLITRYDGTVMASPTSPIEDLPGDVLRASIAVDKDDNVYTSFIQNDGLIDRLYLVRFNNTDNSMEIWDSTNGPAGDWTTTLADGTAIDDGAEDTANPAIAINSINDVYILYQQEVVGVESIFVVRYVQANNEIQNWVGALDTATGEDATAARIVIDKDDVVYGAYRQVVGGDRRLFLIRFEPVADEIRVFVDSTGLWSTDLTDGEPIDDDNGGVSQVQLLMNDKDLYLAYRAGGEIWLNQYDFSEDDVLVWDDDTNKFLNLDPGNSVADKVSRDLDIVSARNPRINVDGNGNVYITYIGVIGLGEDSLYMSRVTGSDLQGWDSVNDEWSTNTDDSQLINTGEKAIKNLFTIMSSNGSVYFSYVNENVGGDDRVYLGVQGRGRVVATAGAPGRRKKSGGCIVTNSSYNYFLAFVMFAFGFSLLLLRRKESMKV